MRNRAEIIEDLHVHTPLCYHAVGTMEEYVQVAINKGIKRLAFLEHLELGIKWHQNLWLTKASFDSYFRIGGRLQEKYADQVEILLGVECGWNADKKDALKKTLIARKWQEIGISCHYIKLPERNLHLNLFSNTKEDVDIAKSIGGEKLFSLYLDELIAAVSFLDGNKLCHLDGALRHIEWQLNREHVEKIEKLLEIVAEKGMKLEINTSGFRFRGEQFPSKKILRIAGKYNLPIAAASDAHRPEDVARDFDKIPPLLGIDNKIEEEYI